MTENNEKPIPRETAGSTTPVLMTEPELIQFLRIPEVSKAKNYRNVIDNLKRFHDLPRIHICRQPLFPLEAVLDWIRNKTEKGK